MTPAEALHQSGSANISRVLPLNRSAAALETGSSACDAEVPQSCRTSGSVREAVKGLAAMAIGFAGADQRWLSQVYNRRSLALAEEQSGIEDIAYANVVSGVYWAADGHWEQAVKSLTYSASLYARLGSIERS
jgi:hypothetical protein